MATAARHELISFVAEMFGTFGFLTPSLLLAQGTVSAAKRGGGSTGPGDVLIISLGFGLALAVQVFIWFRISGGQFNPAVSFALALVRAIPPLRLVVNIAAQLIGAIIASVVVKAIVPGKLLVTSSMPTMLADDGTTEIFVVSHVGALAIEALVTAGLVLTVLFLAVEKHRSTPMAPLLVGLSITVAHLAAVPFTSCGANPARTLGTLVAVGKYPDRGWIFFIGPLIGALYAVMIYTVVKFAGYQDVNPGQDAIKVRRSAETTVLTVPKLQQYQA
ncbi:hypothetical protein PYCC9005_001214 [Savitreella phatthalungensis]